MIEYLRTDYDDLQISFTAASGVTSVIFEVYDLDSDEFIQSGNTASAASSVFIATLTSDSVQYDRRVKIDWTSSTASGASATTQVAEIIRPFATASRIRSLATIESSISDDTLKKQEKKARIIISSLTSNDFSKRYKNVVVYGNNSDVLTLREPVIRIDKVYEDDILIYDSTASVLFNELDYNIEPAVSKFRIKAINDDSDIDRGLLESPDYSVLPYNGIFKKDVQYRIVGVFGYSYVPSDIEQAAALLVEDYLCNDTGIRNKNISKVSNDSYEVTYASNAAQGSGNIIVDNILTKYTSLRYLVI